MFFSLTLSFIASLPQLQLDAHTLAAREPIPSFIPFGRRADSTRNRYISSTLSSNFTTSDRYDRRYRQSVLHVQKSAFTKCAVFGSTVSTGYGGALLLYQSQIDIADSLFEGCSATSGGSIAGIDCDWVVQSTDFVASTAFREGGGIVARFDTSVDMNSWAIESILFLSKCQFAECLSAGVAGALFFCAIRDVTIDQTRFADCQSARLGGAVYSVDCNLLVFRSHFVNNSCGVELTPFDSPPARSSVPDGIRGGAIAFVTNATRAPEQNEMNGFQFGSEESCFCGNAVYANGRPIVAFGGLDIYLVGASKYQTYGDRFVNYRGLAVFADVSGGAAMTEYHTRFYGDGGFFLDGHPCSLAVYVGGYGAFQMAESSVSIGSLQYATLVVVEGENETRDPDDVSVADGSPLGTVRPAVGGRTWPATFRLVSNLSVPAMAIHSPGTPSAAFAKTGGFAGSAGLSETRDFLRSDGAWVTVGWTVSGAFGKTAAFTGSSGNWPPTGPYAHTVGGAATDRMSLSGDLLPTFQPRSAVFEGTRAFTASPSFTMTLRFTQSGAFGASGVFAVSEGIASDGFLSEQHVASAGCSASEQHPASEQRFVGTPRFADTPQFVSDEFVSDNFVSEPHFASKQHFVSDNFVGSLRFSGSSAFARSDVFLPTRSRAPTESSLPSQLSYSFVTLLTQTLTRSNTATQTFSRESRWLSSWVVVQVSSGILRSGSYSLVFSQTWIHVTVITYFPYYVPTFWVTRSRVVVAAQVSTASQAQSGLSNAMIIGIASGSAVVIAVVAAAIIFIVRKSKVAESQSSDSAEFVRKSNQMTESLTQETTNDTTLTIGDAGALNLAMTTYGDEDLMTTPSFDGRTRSLSGIWL